MRWIDAMPIRTRGNLFLLATLVVLGAGCAEFVRAADSDIESARTHWAFRSVREPSLPTVGVSPDASPIDKFIISALKHAGITPSPPADKWALIRRASFDLTGLPPTWDEVQAFVKDDSPDAFAKVVDRLLASPAYGERWGRHWLDIARYADTYGASSLGATQFPFAYTYRDYVIRAFNSDVPYNQFLTEQIAADQIDSGANPRALAALGFLTVGRQFHNPNDLIDDRIDVVTRGLMGLTVACARCHDHKYDPISSADYYSLYAVFAASDSPDDLPLLGKPVASPEYDKYRREIQKRQLARDTFLHEQCEILRARLRNHVGQYLGELAKGVPEQDLSTIFFSYATEDIRPPVLERWRKYLSEEISDDEPVFGIWRRLSRLPADGFAEQSAKIIEQLRNENGERGAKPEEYTQIGARPPRWNPRVLDALASRKMSSMVDVADAYGTLLAKVYQEWQRGIAGTVAGSESDGSKTNGDHSEHTDVNSPVNQQLRRHLFAADTPTAVSDKAGRKLLDRPLCDHCDKLYEAVADSQLSPGSPPRAMTLVERDKSPAQYVFLGGSPIARGDRVEPRFITILAGPNAKPYAKDHRRLQLAESLVDPANPLTSRVVVNWVWGHHFGSGLVRTPDNFGMSGEPPTHPELLDYLAANFMKDGWSIKQLQRRIMLSATYQQSALVRPDCQLADPENRLLWHMPRQRLELEPMRDAMLAVAGRLDLTIGGRPIDLFKKPSTPRRTVYGFINRDVLAQMFSSFDMADPNTCTAIRGQTTVPQQALFALNSDFIYEQAKGLSELDDVKVAISDSDRIDALFRHAYARRPTEKERDEALAWLKTQVGEASKQKWCRLAQVLLASNEFVFLD
jgi:hypothetical protein